MPPRTPPAPYRLKTNLAAPPMARAVSIALGLMRAAGVTRWAEIGDVLPAAVELRYEEYRLLVDHVEILSFLRLAARLPDGTRTQTVTAAVCLDCGEWVLVAGGAGPSRCEMTRGCPGKPVKAAVGSKEKPIRDATAPEPAGLATSEPALPAA